MTLVSGIVLCDIPSRLSMTSSLRAFFGVVIGLFGIAVSIFARISAARCSTSAGASVSPRDGVTTSKRIGRVRENSLKFVAYAGCTTSSNADTAAKRSPGAFTMPVVSIVIAMGTLVVTTGLPSPPRRVEIWRSSCRSSSVKNSRRFATPLPSGTFCALAPRPERSRRFT